MIDTLFLLLNSLIVLMMAVYVIHTERLVLQLKEDLKESLRLENTKRRIERVSEGIFNYANTSSQMTLMYEIHFLFEYFFFI